MSIWFNYFHVKISSDNDLPLENKLKLHSVIKLIKSIIKDEYINYLQVLLEKFWYRY